MSFKSMCKKFKVSLVGGGRSLNSTLSDNKDLQSNHPYAIVYIILPYTQG